MKVLIFRIRKLKFIQNKFLAKAKNYLHGFAKCDINITGNGKLLLHSLLGNALWDYNYGF